MPGYGLNAQPTGLNQLFSTAPPAGPLFDASAQLTDTVSDLTAARASLRAAAVRLYQVGFPDFPVLKFSGNREIYYTRFPGENREIPGKKW